MFSFHRQNVELIEVPRWALTVEPRSFALASAKEDSNAYN